jgi:hypothetical protein
MEMRDCVPQASSLAAAHVKFMGQRTPCINGGETMSSVSHVVPVQVSNVKVPPMGALLGTFTISIFSPTEDE